MISFPSLVTKSNLWYVRPRSFYSSYGSFSFSLTLGERVCYYRSWNLIALALSLWLFSEISMNIYFIHITYVFLLYMYYTYIDSSTLYFLRSVSYLLPFLIWISHFWYSVTVSIPSVVLKLICRHSNILHIQYSCQILFEKLVFSFVFVPQKATLQAEIVN